jgi:hypothetical protein
MTHSGSIRGKIARCAHSWMRDARSVTLSCLQKALHVPTHFDAQRWNASLFDTLCESCNVSSQ